MIPRVRRLLRNPLFLVCATAFLTALLVQSGELGTSDTTHRLQATHSFWTSEPPVDPNDYPEFGIHGRNGKLYGWYGIGQSLLMLPADIAGTYAEQLPIFADYDADPAVRSIVVSYSTNILVCVLAVLVCWRLLGLFGFTTNQKIAGVFALLFCTTFLHYTQNMMENNYILLLTLTGLAFQYEWLKTGSRRALLIGSLALGANLLTRLTTVMDLLAVLLFLLLTAWLTGIRGSALRVHFLALRENRASRLRRFFSDGSRLSVLSLRIFHQHLHSAIRPRAKIAESSAPRRVSVRNAIPRWIPGAAHHAGKIDFSV